MGSRGAFTILCPVANKPTWAMVLFHCLWKVVAEVTNCPLLLNNGLHNDDEWRGVV